jgi:hypothetical protein
VLLFLYRLALKMGRVDVDALAEEMSVDQLYGWMGYYLLEPWGDEWLRSAMTMTQFSNAYRGKNSPVKKVDDFMPVPKRAQTPQQILATLNAIPLPG